MGIDLGKVEAAKAVIKVYVGDTEIELYARLPNTEEKIQYRRDVAKCFNRKGELDYERFLKVCVKWAKKMLTGFREGDLEFNGQPLSPQDEKWKDILAEALPDVMETVCGKLFETYDAEKKLQ